MICLIALPVFLILGIFSVRYRNLAKEAFDCVFRRITFRKCHSKLDQRMKSRITGTLLKYHHGTAKFVFKNFELLSWIFTILMIVSLVYSAIGGYNYMKYGNCNGQGSTAFCIFQGINPIENATNITPCPQNISTYQGMAYKNGS